MAAAKVITHYMLFYMLLCSSCCTYSCDCAAENTLYLDLDSKFDLLRLIHVGCTNEPDLLSTFICSIPESLLFTSGAGS